MLSPIFLNYYLSLGTTKNGKPDGFGIYKWNDGGPNDGDRYEGLYKNGVKHGQGRYFWSNGNAFEGEYMNGVRNGMGIMYTDDGDWYEGLWKNDKPDEKGVLVLNKVKIKVEWKDGKPYPEEPHVKLSDINKFI